MRGAKYGNSDWNTNEDNSIAMKALDEVARWFGYKEVVEECEEYDDEFVTFTTPPEESYNTACSDNPESVRKRLVRRIK